jgi:hypothetical protein
MEPAVANLFRGRRTLRLLIGRAMLRAEARHGASAQWVGETSYTGPADLADAIARLAAESPPGCGRLTVQLERPPLQLRTLGNLPPVKSRDLRALVAQQAGRLFRRDGHALVTDAVWIARGAGRIARAAAVDEALIEAIAAGARAAGLRLGAIVPADATAALALLPRSERERRERTARRRTRRLAVAAGTVWLVVCVLFFGRLAWERRAIERELAALERPLAAVLAARRELRDAETTIAVVAAAERERGRSLTVLGAITKALPDSSVLTTLAWNTDGAGMIAGAGRRAADIIARLTRVSVLAEVRPEGPILREPLGGREWERFTVLFGGERDRARRDGS